MKLSLPKLMTESKIRTLFREELREYLSTFNESNDNHNKSIVKQLERIHAKLDKQEHTTMTYPPQVAGSIIPLGDCD